MNKKGRPFNEYAWLNGVPSAVPIHRGIKAAVVLRSSRDLY
jgi:hypothetical protein